MARAIRPDDDLPNLIKRHSVPHQMVIRAPEAHEPYGVLRALKRPNVLAPVLGCGSGRRHKTGERNSGYRYLEGLPLNPGPHTASLWIAVGGCEHLLNAQLVIKTESLVHLSTKRASNHPWARREAPRGKGRQRRQAVGRKPVLARVQPPVTSLNRGEFRSSSFHILRVDHSNGGRSLYGRLGRPG